MVIDLKEGTSGSGIFYCSDKSIRKTKNGSDYADVTLRDKTGSVQGKIWGYSEQVHCFEKGDVVSVGFRVDTFNGSKQLKITSILPVDSSKVNIEDFYATSEYDVEKMWSCMLELLQSVTDEWYSRVIHAFIDDSEWVTKFKRHSAAVTVHHAFVGGLLQHTLFVMRICNSLSKIYSLDRGLLLTAAFLHDIGKMNEISGFPENDYTDCGDLIGHVSEGAYLVRRVCESIEGFPVEKRDNLVHCILAHHGALEFGSPKLPALVEAVALSKADGIDACLETAFELLADGSDKVWNKYSGAWVVPTTRKE